MEIWIASSNKGKLKELQQLLEPKGFKVHSQNELDFYASPAENGDSFEANAQIKAKSLAAVKNKTWVLADDSGLCVDGLGGLPGVHSARYAGDNARDAENTAKVLKMLQIRSPLNRAAKFICKLAAISPEGEMQVFTGELKGSISKSQKGSGGFGYDNVFIPEGFEKTLAELSPAEKNRLSHRAQALKSFLETQTNPS